MLDILGFVGFVDLFVLQCSILLQQRGRFRASKAAQSRRGKVNVDFPPDPLVLPCDCASGCNPGRLWLLRVALNFRFQRKQPIAKSPHGLLCKLSGSRTGLKERVAHV